MSVTAKDLQIAREQSTAALEIWRKKPTDSNTVAKDLAAAVADDTVNEWIRQGCAPVNNSEHRSIRDLQKEQRTWSAHNFGHLPSDPIDAVLGIVEEVGELAHAVLKSKQGIRGTATQHDASAKDALADVFIFMLDYCTRRKWDLQDIIETTWNEVRRRDWKRYPVNGFDQ